jgi:mono/diheme cytochrome c family protein
VQSQRDKYKGKQDELESDFRKIAAWLATGPRAKPADNSPHASAYKLVTEKFNCVRCHQFADKKGQKNVPMLTGYGSADWLRLMVRAPGLPHTYGDNNAMPAFRDLEGMTGELEKQEYANLIKKKVAEVAFANVSDADREALVRYLAEEQRLLVAGRPPPEE